LKQSWCWQHPFYQKAWRLMVFKEVKIEKHWTKFLPRKPFFAGWTTFNAGECLYISFVNLEVLLQEEPGLSRCKLTKICHIFPLAYLHFIQYTYSAT
jgi:hypothetical protein